MPLLRRVLAPGVLQTEPGQQVFHPFYLALLARHHKSHLVRSENRNIGAGPDRRHGDRSAARKQSFCCLLPVLALAPVNNPVFGGHRRTKHRRLDLDGRAIVLPHHRRRRRAKVCAAVGPPLHDRLAVPLVEANPPGGRQDLNVPCEAVDTSAAGPSARAGAVVGEEVAQAPEPVVAARGDLQHLAELRRAGLHDGGPDLEHAPHLGRQVVARERVLDRLALQVLERGDRVRRLAGQLLEVILVWVFELDGGARHALVDPREKPVALRRRGHDALRDLVQLAVEARLLALDHGEDVLALDQVDRHAAAVDPLGEDPDALLLGRQRSQLAHDRLLGHDVLVAVAHQLGEEVRVLDPDALAILGRLVVDAEPADQVLAALALELLGIQAQRLAALLERLR